jgi:hypothetical protein
MESGRIAADILSISFRKATNQTVMKSFLGFVLVNLVLGAPIGKDEVDVALGASEQAPTEGKVEVNPAEFTSTEIEEADIGDPWARLVDDEKELEATSHIDSKLYEFDEDDLAIFGMGLPRKDATDRKGQRHVARKKRKITFADDRLRYWSRMAPYLQLRTTDKK